jgi:type IX secretion system PorP/SprF family membrane protein
MKKNRYLLLVSFMVICLHCMAQSDQHYTMFMYNKLLYNPGYTGSREVLSINGTLRQQWSDVPGAPKSSNISADAPLGTFMRPFRKLAAGLSIGTENEGIEQSVDLRTYYAYRIQLTKSVVSFGLSAGANFYTAQYDKVNVFQGGDPSFDTAISNAMLPAFGAGIYWSGDKFYCGLSVPNMLQNYYDKNLGRLTSKQIRAFYLSGGYAIAAGEELTIQPQVLVRYAVNGLYRLPVNADINLSLIAYKRIMLGVTYRTNGSLVGIVHLQVSKRLNIGYAYEHSSSALSSYSGGTHEVVLGYDFVRDNFKLLTPRFIRKF